MISPVRSIAAFTRGAPASILVSSVAVTTLFSATPFLIPELAARFGVSDGEAGSISVIQVGVFAATNLVLPRLVPPSGRIFRMAGWGLVVGNVLAVAAPTFPLVLATRVITGCAAGALTWLAWSAAMTTERGVTSMSSIGPLAALVAAPVIAVVAGAGDVWVWALLAVVAVPGALLRPASFDVAARPGERSGSRSNRVLLAALFVLTMSGAALFVYERVIAVDELGLTPLAASFGFSLNAAAGLAGARLATRHRRPGLWLASAGPAAALTVIGGSAVWFYVGLAWWGFAFWMGVPGVLGMLAARSLRPDERAGDAQGIMAFGRSLGPGVGGVWIDGGQPGVLAMAAGAGLLASGLIVVGVQEGRESLPPTDIRTISP